MDRREEIYHIFEQEAVRRNKPLEGYERTEAIGRAILQLVEEEPLLGDWLTKPLAKRKDSIREDAKTVPIFAMTANAFAEDREKTRAAGMNEHLAKPLDPKLLLSKIVQYCRPQTAM